MNNKQMVEKVIPTGFLLLLLLLLMSCNTPRIIVKDDLTGLRTFTSVEFPPKLNGQNSFMQEFMAKFSFKYEQEEQRQYGFIVQFVIDKRGHLVGARIPGKKEQNYTRVEKEIINTLNQIQGWTPGKIDGKDVNVLVTPRLNIGFR